MGNLYYEGSLCNSVKFNGAYREVVYFFDDETEEQKWKTDRTGVPAVKYVNKRSIAEYYKVHPENGKVEFYRLSSPYFGAEPGYLTPVDRGSGELWYEAYYGDRIRMDIFVDPGYTGTVMISRGRYQISGQEGNVTPLYPANGYTFTIGETPWGLHPERGKIVTTGCTMTVEPISH